MPNKDGTGPAGNGPQTGRGKGLCDSSADDKKPIKRGGQGRGSGRCCSRLLDE